MTDVAIEEVLRPHKTVNIIWQPQTFLPYHPNGMKFVGKDLNGDIIDEWTVYSIGGGAISDGTAGNQELGAKDVYDLNKLADIKQWCYDNGRSFWEYVEKCESEDIWDYLDMVWQTMKQSIRNGLDHEGVLPGPLKLQRKAATYYIKAKGYRASLQSRGLVYAYALAVSEENASGGTIVTAPTCGACGVLPAVLYHMFTSHDMSEQRILRALATAGLVGNIVKQNASISGADVGCQGEVGVACAMASAAACQLFGGSPAQVEYAAEMGLEHHLGMTCDPVCGLVQIPCIERNAFAAARALDADLSRLHPLRGSLLTGAGHALLFPAGAALDDQHRPAAFRHPDIAAGAVNRQRPHLSPGHHAGTAAGDGSNTQIRVRRGRHGLHLS